jgi:hypothetical protein
VRSSGGISLNIVLSFISRWSFCSAYFQERTSRRKRLLHGMVQNG